MFTAIVRFSIKKKLFVGLTTLFLFIGGIYAMLTLSIDAVPDITNNQVQIVTGSDVYKRQYISSNNNVFLSNRIAKGLIEKKIIF